MTTSADILDLVYGALTASPVSTAAGPRVYRPGDWPTQIDQYPIIKLRVVREQKLSTGRANLNFTTTSTLRLIGEVSAPAQMDDAGATDAEAQLWALAREMEVAVINSSPLFQVIQQLATVDSQFAFAAERTHLAGIQSDMAFEYYQGPEDFYPVDTVDLDEADIAVSTLPPAGLRADLSQE